MAAGGRDLQRALGAFLALDVGKVERGVGNFENFRLRPREHLRAFEVVGELDERVRRDDLHVGARPGGLRPARIGTDQPLRARIRADRRGQHPRDRRNRAIEPELAQHGEAIHRVMRDRTDRRHQAERNREVEMAAFLRKIGGRHVDRDAPRRQRKPGSHQRGTNALARLRHRLVGQADHVESRQARRDLHLDIDGARLDAFERDRRNALDHAGVAPQGKYCRFP